MTSKLERRSGLPTRGASFPAWGIAQLKEVGLIGLIPSHLPADAAFPLVDALLAAPVLIAAVDISTVSNLSLLADICSKARELMLVGADISAVGGAERDALMDPRTAVREALEAGAHFLIVSGSQAAVCAAHHIPHIPVATTAAQLSKLEQENGHLVVTSLENFMGVIDQEQLQPPLDLVVRCGALAAEQMEMLAKLGAAAVMTPLWFSGQSSLRATIVRARELSAAWQEAKKSEDDFST